MQSEGGNLHISPSIKDCKTIAGEDITEMEKKNIQETAKALDSLSREGYFGGAEVDISSNAKEGKERIVLSDKYGKQDEDSQPPKKMKKTEDKSEAVNLLESCGGRYKNKVTIVTGGSKGIGEGCVRVFFAAGSNVVFCSRGESVGQRLATELNEQSCSNRALFVRADVSKVEQIQNLIDVTMKEFGKIDCIINNAGWHPPPKTIDDFTITEMQDLFQLNFISIFAACKYALPHLRKTNGNIINMSSWVGAYGQAQAPTYTATKGAITAFSKALAIDEAKKNVRVNVVSPGNIWTPLWKSWCVFQYHITIYMLYNLLILVCEFRSDGEPDPNAARKAGDIVQCMGRKGTIIETGKLCLAIAAVSYRCCFFIIEQ